MIRLNILCPNTPGSRFDMDYYVAKHMPMSKHLFGEVLKEVSLRYGMAGVELNSPGTCIMSCHMRFESIEAFVEACARSGDELGGDIPKYTDAPPVIQISRILPPV